MVTKLASPGVFVQEKDFTRGGIDPSFINFGAFAGVFEKGPIGIPTLVTSEAELLEIFGRPNDENFEYWFSVSNYLEYGGICYVVRVQDPSQYNAVSNGSEQLVKSFQHWEDEVSTGAGTYKFIARTAGTWGNSLGVSVIDYGADQRLVLDSGAYVFQTGQLIADLAEIRVSSTVGISVGDTLYGGTGFLTPKGEVTKVDTINKLVRIRYALGQTFSVDDAFSDSSGGAQLGTINVVTNIPLYVYNWNPSTKELDVISDAFPATKVVATDGFRDGSSGAGALRFTRASLGTTAASHTSGTSVDLLNKGLVDGIVIDNAGGAALAADGTTINLSGSLSIAATGGVIDADQYLLIDNELIEIEGAAISGNVITLTGTGQRGVLGTADAQHADGAAVRLYTLELGKTTITSAIGTDTTSDTYDYADIASSADFDLDDLVVIDNEIVTVTSVSSGDPVDVISTLDWWDLQNVYEGKPWYTVAAKPGTSQFGQEKFVKYDEMHVIVYDRLGSITGTPGAVLESFLNVSKIAGAKTPQGENNYFLDVVKANSDYVYAKSLSYTVTDISGAITSPGSGVDTDGQFGSMDYGTDGNILRYDLIGSQSWAFSGGGDDQSPTVGEVLTAYEEFQDTEEIDIDFIIQGPAGSNLVDAITKAKAMISLCDSRKDCMAFISPYRSALVGISNSKTQLDNVVNFFQTLDSSSYVVFDSGYKYMYDRFNDVYRYVPLNADIAGLMVNTATVADPWFSPAGLNRGNIRNCVKLAFNPKKSQRDTLYTNRINPVASFPGEGTVLFGDKTGLAVKSAFDRINVRKLFLVVEKAIARASRAQLFEFNDVVTRTLFVQIVDPYLRDVQARRGITDYLVVCDESNNPAYVIDNNEFRADIYIKPARSINFITLTFIATRTGVSFDEVIALNRGAS